MLINILIVLFVLGMAYWWGSQGLFSAFLHLMVVILAGSIALALWEPLVLGFLGYRLPQYAWTVGLLGPFALLLIGLRVAFDKLVPKNVQFHPILNMIAGGFLGVCSAVLTAGLTVIGLMFLPFGTDLAGYQPYMIGGDGKVEVSSSQLWIPVDDMTYNVFASLSTGAFTPIGSGQGLAYDQAELPKLAALTRLRYDDNSSMVVLPDAVTIGDTFSLATPVEGVPPQVAESFGVNYKDGNHKVVIIDTDWQKTDADRITFDSDATLRLPPAHAVLVTESKSGGSVQTHTHTPVGYTKEDRDTQQRWYTPFNDDRVFAFMTGSKGEMAFVYLIPAGETPTRLMLRHTRFNLGDTVTNDPQLVASAVGDIWHDSEVATTGGPSNVQDPNVGLRNGVRSQTTAVLIEQKGDLPRPISTNYSRGLTVQNEAVVSGTGTATKPPGSLSKNTRAVRIFTPTHQRAVRIKLEDDKAMTFLGASRAAAASLGGVWVEDHRGDKHAPIGWAWLQSSGEQKIHVDLQAPIRSIGELPGKEIRPGDEFYIYFNLEPGITLTSYNISSHTEQGLNFTVSADK